jgi:hypothetical protein
MGLVFKILLIVIVCVAVLFGKRIWRSMEIGKAARPEIDKPGQRPVTGLDRCTKCGAFVDASEKIDCARGDCPYAA